MLGVQEHKGWWWPADDKSKERPGTLTVTDGESVVELIGTLGEVVISEGDGQKVIDPFRVQEPPRLLGRTADKRDITLEGPSLGSAGHLSTYHFPWALIGKAFGPEEEIAFDEIAIEISDLDTWCGVSGLSRAPADPSKPDGGLSDIWSVEFNPPETIEIPLDNDESAALHFLPSQGTWRPVPTSVTVAQRAVFTLRFARRHNLHEVADRVGELRKFLCLAVGRPVAVISVIGYQDDYRYERGDRRREIEVLWGIPHNPQLPDAPKHPYQMLFTMADAPGGISQTLNAWFAIQQRYRPVLNLFFGMRFHPDMYGDLRFIIYAQAIETYHLRRTAKDCSLDTRIRETLADCPTVTEHILVAASQTLHDFVEAFKVSRNYYTHYDPKKERRAAEGVSLAALTLQVQTLIEMSLLREIGFTCEQIDSIFNDHAPRYREIRNTVDQIDDQEVVTPSLPRGDSEDSSEDAASDGGDA